MTDDISICYRSFTQTDNMCCIPAADITCLKINIEVEGNVG